LWAPRQPLVHHLPEHGEQERRGRSMFMIANPVAAEFNLAYLLGLQSVWSSVCEIASTM